MATLCSNCKFRAAAKLCIGDGCARALFCSECSSFHANVKPFRGHKFQDYRPPSPSSKVLHCCNCDTAIAKLRCLDCIDSVFCNPCSIIHPKVKQYRNHRVESLPEAERRVVKFAGEIGEIEELQESAKEEEEPLAVAAWAYKVIGAIVSALAPDKSGSTIMDNRRRLVVAGFVCLGVYLLLKHLFGRHVSVIVAVGCIVGLRWFQRKQQYEQQAGTARIISQAKKFDPSPAAFRSLSAAAAAVDAQPGMAAQFMQEFWHARSATRRANKPPMRVQLKNGGGKASFNASSDT